MTNNRPEPVLITRAGRERTKDILIDEPSAAEREAAAKRSERMTQWANRKRD